MEKIAIIWKKAEESFIIAHDLAAQILNRDIVLSYENYGRFYELLRFWVKNLEQMLETVSDVEMAQDFKFYLERLKQQQLEFEELFL